MKVIDIKPGALRLGRDSTGPFIAAHGYDLGRDDGSTTASVSVSVTDENLCDLRDAIDSIIGAADES